MAGMVNSNFLEKYRGKRVLVTGDTGFKGSWLTFWLTEIGATVMGYALPPENKLFEQLRLSARCKHIDGDLLDYDRWSQAVNEFQPEVVFHLAAQALVRKSYQQPRLTFSTNVMGSVHVLEALRECASVKAIVYVTSDKCYANKEWAWGYRENDELGGRDPYSASKACAELVFTSYCRSFFDERKNVGIASVRAGNVIGGGDWSSDRIVPDCIRSILGNQNLMLRSPAATRPWQHVLEPLSGYLLIGSRLLEAPEKYSGSWNFGPDDGMRSVLELTRRIVDVWGKGGITVAEKANFHEAGLLHLSIDKARQQLDWQPRWRFEELVRRTVEWYKLTEEGEDPQSVTNRQINAYCSAGEEM